MPYLRPIMLKERYYEGIEEEINRLFNKLLYSPLMDIMGMEIQNTANILLQAIANGTIWYANGKFQGKFNARISSALKAIGGSFNRPSGSWSLAREFLPADVSIALAQADSRYKDIQRRMLVMLDEINVSQVDTRSQLQKNYERTISAMEIDLQKTLPRAPETALSRITIEAKLTDEQKRIIAQDWGQNLNLYIKGWLQENILKLREEMQPHIIAGGRALGLVKILQENYGVSQRKAKFLARQETALLMSKFQETRYKGLGIQRYRWSDSHDVRVRHDHHDLNGRIFSWDDPPIVNRKTGKRANPGQDYNCRCIAVPVVE